MKTDFSKIDTVMVYHLYTAFVGDVQKCALAADLSEDVVRELAEKFNWRDKIKRTSILRKEGKAGEWEICVSKAISFSQAHIFRSVIQRVLEVMAKKDNEDLLTSLTQTKAGRVEYSAKFLSDLASAMEKCHHLCAFALEPADKDNPKDETVSMASLHASVLAALSNPIAAGVERNLLQDSIEDMVKDKIPTRPPEDNGKKS